MKRYLGVFLVLCAAAGSSLLPPDALATVIDLNYTSIATGVDDGPEDGVFDSFTSLNLGSVNDNGYTAFRTAAAFDLSSVPPTATVNRATLTVVISNFEGARSLAVHGYAGDGVVQLADFALGGLLATASVAPTGTQTVQLDVTSFVSDLVAGGSTFAGFNVREEPPNTANFTIMQLAVPGTPVLTIDYAPVSGETVVYDNTTTPLGLFAPLTTTWDVPLFWPNAAMSAAGYVMIGTDTLGTPGNVVRWSFVFFPGWSSLTHTGPWGRVIIEGATDLQTWDPDGYRYSGEQIFGFGGDPTKRFDTVIFEPRPIVFPRVIDDTFGFHGVSISSGENRYYTTHDGGLTWDLDLVEPFSGPLMLDATKDTTTFPFTTLKLEGGGEAIWLTRDFPGSGAAKLGVVRWDVPGHSFVFSGWELSRRPRPRGEP